MKFHAHSQTERVGDISFTRRSLSYEFSWRHPRLAAAIFTGLGFLAVIGALIHFGA